MAEGHVRSPLRLRPVLDPEATEREANVFDYLRFGDINSSGRDDDSDTSTDDEPLGSVARQDLNVLEDRAEADLSTFALQAIMNAVSALVIGRIHLSSRHVRVKDRTRSLFAAYALYRRDFLRRHRSPIMRACRDCGESTGSWCDGQNYPGPQHIPCDGPFCTGCEAALGVCRVCRNRVN